MNVAPRYIALLMVLCCTAVPAILSPQPAHEPLSADEQRCAALARLDLEAAPAGPTRIASARLIDVPPAGLEGGPNRMSGFGRRGAGAIRIKKYCSVTGLVAPQNKFELRLPLPAEWNKKFFFAACGGFCGTVNGALCVPALERGYAAVTTNGGHESAPGFDGVWAANAPNLQEDFAWRGVHVVTLAAKDITTRYYGEAISRAYMSGCSKGGQAVLMEAQRFPEDFDGLMPVAPVYDYTGRSVIAAAWFAQAVSDGRGGSVITPATVEAVHRSVLQHCGAQAGVDEGLVTDPASCTWKSSMIACAPGVENDQCLGPKQVHAIARLMAPATNSRGEVIYRYPYVPGTETEWAGWNFPALRMGRTAPEFGNLKVADQYLKYLADATVRRNVDPLKFDFDRDPATLGRARALYDAASADLRAFKARGGRMLMWHGLADSGIAASASIGYYDAVVKELGGRAQTDDFFRLFLIPGVHHCGGGPGLSEFDTLTALEEWLEKGRAPDQVIASRSNAGVVERSRPVYPYPVLAKYVGAGDPRDASSFVPAAGR
ncbi:MAG TPA: tannase/feruloyl esterase family alpha/beta hydrolase [Methylomirabilota bacterium]|nr:tannase/feruloyl esterase family alpha/beta hydrolase [Methylomirabilota bacterium]